MKLRRLSWLLLISACSRGSEAEPPLLSKADEAPAEELAAPPAPAAVPAKRERAKKSAPGRAGSGVGLELSVEGGLADLEEKPAGPAGGEAAQPARSWFPETFLFEPLVKTGEDGKAEVKVDVPDRLTSWRVLALAHSRAGSQAGAVTTFLGTLPTYVDPIVPPFAMSGDVLMLPVQVVNTTNEPVSAELSLSVEGAALTRAGGPVTVPAGGSVVRYADVRVTKPGTMKLRAALGDADAVVKSVPVLPTGRPRTIEKSGTLAAPRKLTVTLPERTDDESARVRLSVFPGALAILKAELQAGPGRGGVADDAYLLLLSGRAKVLLEKLGADVDEAWLRRLRIIATQRAIRHARSPDPATAALLAEAALAHEGSPVLSRLGERLATQLAGAQRPDGTFGGGRGWTLQRLMVATADGVRAVRSAGGEAGQRRARGVVLKASGAFERQLARIEDPYTAAAVLASHAVSGPMADRLADRVKKAIETAEDGSKRLVVGSGVVRPDGRRPTTVEATALAALALADREEGLLPDLGASILASYRPSTGFGDGYTNLMALRAVLAIFDEPLPSKVQVKLTMDGRVLTEGELSGAKLKEVLYLDAPIPSPAGGHTMVVEATPPVPGLGFALSVRHYVPWAAEAQEQGMELSLDLSKDARVGHPIDVTLRAIAPAGMALSIRQALPAGVQVDQKSLSDLVSDGTLIRYDTEDGAVTLEAPSRRQGQTFTAKYRVIPTLAGTLHTSASSLSPLNRKDQVFYVPPTVWHVSRD